MIPSPCRRNCCLNLADVCIGCGRTIEEITGWHSADDAGKQAILIAAAQRVALSQPSYSSVPRKSDLDRSN